MSAKLRRQCRKRKRRLLARIDKNRGAWRTPMMNPSTVNYDLAEKQQAVACGGLGMILELVKRTGLRREINRTAPVFKLHAPYDETDHVLNIALCLLTGGTCLEHLEQRRNDEAYLDALGAPRIPDPTTAGDFCRRFDEFKTLMLMQGIHRARRVVWREQPREFFKQATIEADGTMVQTRGEKKQGIGMNYKGQWGYCPLVVSLAETQEVLYLANRPGNRPGNRPSHEHAAFYLDLAVDECRRAGFEKITLRGDTDFALTENFDRWDDGGVEFVFGIDTMPNLVQIAENLGESSWTDLRRQQKRADSSRTKRPNHKEAFVQEKGYRNLKLRGESYAEFDYRPTKCDRPYRVVALRKDIDAEQHQQRLFGEVRYFFYITNARRSELPAPKVIASANKRCNQENMIAQLKAQGALAAPLDSLVSNWAYMVIASLAWTLKCWCGLMIRPAGRKEQRAEQAQTRRRVLRMEFATFVNCFMQLPAQIVRTSRRLIYRLLTYRPSVDVLLLMHAHIRRPLRC